MSKMFGAHVCNASPQPRKSGRMQEDMLNVGPNILAAEGGVQKKELVGNPNIFVNDIWG